MTEVVYQFCREAQSPFAPAVGRGASQQRSTPYSHPTQTGTTVRKIGAGFQACRGRESMRHQNAN